MQICGKNGSENTPPKPKIDGEYDPYFAEVEESSSDTEDEEYSSTCSFF